MRRVRVVVWGLLAGVVAMATAGCGSSSSVTGADVPAPAAKGAAVLHGAIQAPGLGSASTGPGVSADSAGSGWVVSIVGTSISAELDAEGRFVLTFVPSGTVTVKIDGPGVSVQVPVSGLVDGQVTSVEIRVTGGSAHLVAPPKCTPSAETYFSGSLDQAAGSQLVVGGRSVDASQLKVVWRGSRRIQLSDLVAGEPVKVWGTLRGDGVVVAEEIAALTSGALTWVTFTGRIDSCSGGYLSSDDVVENPDPTGGCGSSLSADDVVENPTPTPSSYPTIVVKGITVKTAADTRVLGADGSELSPSHLKVGQTVTVEGWKDANGTVRAAKVTIH